VPNNHNTGNSLRLKGRNLTECEHVKLGAYHTLELEPTRSFTLTKDSWEPQDVERVASACDPAAAADVAAVLISDGQGGMANVCLVGGSATLVKARIEANLPRKRGAAAAAGYDKALDKFFARVYEAALKAVSGWSVVRCLVIAGPGFAKDAFRTYMAEEAQRRGDKAFTLGENWAKVVVAPAPSAYVHSLKEALAAPALAATVADTKFAREAKALAELHRVMASEPARAMYGPGHVSAAAEMGAVATLLLSDALFRVRDAAKRKRYAALVEGVRAVGGEALVLSSLHESGEQLNQLGGVAAVLRFPLPELEDMEMVEDEEVVAAAQQASSRAKVLAGVGR
jgi:protein pelota